MAVFMGGSCTDHMGVRTKGTILFRVAVDHAIEGIPPDASQIAVDLEAGVGTAQGQGVGVKRVQEEILCGTVSMTWPR